MTNTLHHQETLRKCTRCLEDKPATEFYKHKNGRDGLDAHCKECSKLPAATRSCRACGEQWTAREPGRSTQLCIACRSEHKVGIGKLGDTVEGLNRAESYLWSKRNVLAELASGLHDLSENCFG